MNAESETSDRPQYNQAWDVGTGLRWFWNRSLEIAMIVGLILCLPDFAREVGFLGIALAVTCSILIAGRTIAQALRDGRQ